jgi:hypothetical protein
MRSFVVRFDPRVAKLFMTVNFRMKKFRKQRPAIFHDSAMHVNHASREKNESAIFDISDLLV